MESRLLPTHCYNKCKKNEVIHIYLNLLRLTILNVVIIHLVTDSVITIGENVLLSFIAHTQTKL
jgi:hypothetical protein